ncbi:acyl-CoA oxidase [Decorospora gaudefroyi]|uniref:Acyl-coenzyme A oxidase n=1 Tax=Decorospora gaudefroyi TaxID=184978 RepID=A0A6A5K895_9PLEO|nr:acyl-CoA oxidase [Decorospora gaudefroyi]KAF1832510.1 acyl-CoA oxidase [Decorospora gaudefroyi]
MVENLQVALMRKARASSSFRPRELTNLLWGSERVANERRAAFERVEKTLGTYETAKLPRCYSETSREDLFEQGLEMGKVCLDDMLEYEHEHFVWITPRYNLVNASPFGHKAILFEPAMEHNGTAEQKSKWLPLARSGKILGTYAQTELGHGSFVRGIETTATFDQETDEFVIHSPTISSAKFWPAGLGFSTTHGTVMARLLVGDKDHGPHLFVVQLRSVGDGKRMPGIKMGDIGLKLGYNEADNGFASFNHVRIPRSHMLMAHSQLSRNGTFAEDPLRAKLSYSVMLLVRGKMPGVFAVQLAQALTIATRYSVVRQQGLGPVDALNTETNIIHYKHQHFRLLSLIAKTYAMFFASRACDTQYNKLRKMQCQADHSLLPSVHALTAGLKAYVTSEAVDGAEDCRKLCGGHGYMVISGLPNIIGALAGGATFEGENYVLWQQLGRHLLKQLDRFQDGETIEPQVQYLAEPKDPNTSCMASGEQFLDAGVQLGIYRDRAHRLVVKAHTAIRASGKMPAEAWNEHMMLLIYASRAHMDYFILKSFVDIIAALPDTMSESLGAVLKRVCSLFALSTIVNPRSVDVLSFIETTGTQQPYLTCSQLDTMRSLVNGLLDQLLPEAVALTDAWDFSDASLCSALGMYDGNVYKNIMRWVEQLPINQNAQENGGVQEGWAKWVDPILKRAKL